jgi:hypothetical protein
MNITPVAISGIVPQQKDSGTSASSAVSADSFSDTLDISVEAKLRINEFESGTESLEQAVKEARKQARQAAADKVSMAHEYLRLLKQMSSPDDPAAAREAARIAREIHGATASYREAVGGEDPAAIGKEVATFATTAGKALAIAKEVVERYLKHKKQDGEDGHTLRESVDGAFTALKSLVNEGISDGISQITTLA